MAVKGRKLKRVHSPSVPISPLMCTMCRSNSNGNKARKGVEICRLVMVLLSSLKPKKCELDSSEMKGTHGGRTLREGTFISDELASGTKAYIMYFEFVANGGL